MKRRATRTHQKPGVGNYEKTSNTDSPKTRGGQLLKDEQHGPTKNRGWATMKRRATRTHQKQRVGNYEKTSNTDPPKTRGGNYEKTSNTNPPKTEGGQL